MTSPDDRVNVPLLISVEGSESLIPPVEDFLNSGGVLPILVMVDEEPMEVFHFHRLATDGSWPVCFTHSDRWAVRLDMRPIYTNAPSDDSPPNGLTTE